MNKFWVVAIGIVLIVGGFFVFARKRAAAPSQPGAAQNAANTAAQQSTASSSSSISDNPGSSGKSGLPFVAPIADAAARATKKFFGTYVTPENSPVQPERFMGYHTGLDFETFPAEQNTDVAINTICAGKLLVKEWASGYGGVAVQSCTLNGAAVTVIYGHLRQSSIAPKVGEILQAGQHLAVLGNGYSQETDGERKHLHLGIHKGAAINILGYVQQASQLSGWIDPATVVQE